MNDAFGRFTCGEGRCAACGRVGLSIRYVRGTFELPQGIDVGKTILRVPTNRLGIGCGDYGKFHRQVTHISHKMRSKPRDTQETG